MTGGFIGYHWATHHGSEAKCAGWTNQEGRPHGWGRRWQQQQPLPVAEGNYPTQAPTSTGNGAPIPSGIEPHEFALFQQWKQQQQQQLSQQPRSPFPALQQPPNYDAMKAGAVESADRALDAILSQVQGMKEVSTSQTFPVQKRS